MSARQRFVLRGHIVEAMRLDKPDRWFITGQGSYSDAEFRALFVAFQPLPEPAPADGWQPIETAPKGGGAKRTDDPAWVEPPWLLVYGHDEDDMAAASWDWYYAEGGNGHDGGSAWVLVGGERVNPPHWMRLPAPPVEGGK